MKRLNLLLSHATVILAVVLTVLLVVDRINPLMEFLNNDLAKGLLAALCGGSLLSGIGSIILYYRKK